MKKHTNGSESESNVNNFIIIFNIKIYRSSIKWYLIGMIFGVIEVDEIYMNGFDHCCEPTKLQTGWGPERGTGGELVSAG